MKVLFVAAALALATTTIAQTKQARQVGNFTSISTAAGIYVELTQGTTNDVVVSASNDDYVNKIKTEVDNNGVLKLYVEYEKGNNKKWKNIKYTAYVTYKAINKLTASSGSIIATKNTILATNLNVDVSSGAIITADVKADNSNTQISSGAIAKLSGTINNLTIAASSGAIFNSKDVVVNDCTAAASSGAVIKATIQKSLTASASSGGSIKYMGTPTIQKKTSSGGEIKPMN